MDLKRICFVICVLIICLSIAGVSASENITDNEISSNNDEMEVYSILDGSTNSLKENSQWIEEKNTTDTVSGGLNEKGEVLSSTNEETLKAGDYDFYVSPDGAGNGESIDNPTNWTYAMDHSFNRVKIKLLNGTYNISSISLTYPGFTLVGSQNTIIDAQFNGFIFTVTQDNTVFENITFINGKSSNEGGAIIWQGKNGLINNCIFRGNSLSRDDGGALFFTGAADNCVVNNTRFERNSAMDTGAVYWKGPSGSLINCTFIENTATEAYAAVYWNANNGNIVKCKFINGSSKMNGGLCSNGDNINIEYCSFINNRATIDGAGALNISGGSNTISNCNFKDNYASTYGGAICMVASEGILKNCVFNNNTARAVNGGGGAIYWTGSNGEIQNCNFTNNKVIKNDDINYLGHGGAILWNISSSKGISGSNFFNNTAYSGSKRLETAMHMEVAKEHGFTDIAEVDIMDRDGYMVIPVEGGKNLKENWVGQNLANYDYVIVLTHFKGHPMAGFGGALKNISIGIASNQGKVRIHSGGKLKKPTITLAAYTTNQNIFTESMAEAAKSVSDYEDHGKKMIYISVMNNMSIDCDCVSEPAAVDMHDIGILASTDPVALDQACIDQVFLAPDSGSLQERILSKNGLHILKHAEEIGFGNRAYQLIDVDE